MKATTLSAAAAAIMFAATASWAGAPVEPPRPVPAPAVWPWEARYAGAAMGSAAVEAFVWARRSAGADPEVCVDVWSRDRYDVGCGAAEVTIDPLLGSATVRGTIPSHVYGGRRRVRPSTITVALTLQGEGVHEWGAGQGAIVSPRWIEAGAGLAVWRLASGWGSVSSAGLPGTGTVPLREAVLAAEAGGYAVAGGGGGDECGDAPAARGC